MRSPGFEKFAAEYFKLSANEVADWYDEQKGTYTSWRYHVEHLWAGWRGALGFIVR